jgi:hypothetical protein
MQLASSVYDQPKMIKGNRLVTLHHVSSKQNTKASTLLNHWENDI